MIGTLLGYFAFEFVVVSLAIHCTGHENRVCDEDEEYRDRDAVE